MLDSCFVYFIESFCISSIFSVETLSNVFILACCLGRLNKNKENEQRWNMGRCSMKESSLEFIKISLFFLTSILFFLYGFTTYERYIQMNRMIDGEQEVMASESQIDKKNDSPSRLQIFFEYGE